MTEKGQKNCGKEEKKKIAEMSCLFAEKWKTNHDTDIVQ